MYVNFILSTFFPKDNFTTLNNIFNYIGSVSWDFWTNFTWSIVILYRNYPDSKKDILYLFIDSFKYLIHKMTTDPLYAICVILYWYLGISFIMYRKNKANMYDDDDDDYYYD